MPIFQVIRVLFLSFAAFFVALAITPIFTRLLQKRRLVKANIRPEKSAPIFNQLHKNKSGTPTMGGVIIWSTVISLAVLFWILDSLFDGFWGYLNFIDRAQTYLPLTAMLLAAAVGLFDDLLGVFKIGPHGGGIKVRHKLILYAFMAAIGAWWFYFRLGWDILYIPFLGNFQIGWWYFPFFMFIIIASAFSANETDGLDGLAGGVLLTAFASLTVVAFVLGRYDLAAFGGTVIGALLAFLWFNIYPARFFMGDTGSMSLGITLGVIAMLTNTAILLPFFAFILVLESLSVIIQMASKKILGKKIFLSAPIHHHFEALGWPETQVTMRFWIISAIFSALGLIIFFLARFF
ncbi:MAG: phospho-N-acetylmuramoyl-pentapeptide-transferase [Candidatus Brennerbacteria bacterium]|nr:phospho-N-acetylmuramoyl-pentapeptide-transferase [Candidatus Brennerbacteria bacterium]